MPSSSSSIDAAADADMAAPPRPAFRTLPRATAPPAGVAAQMDNLTMHIIKPLQGKGIFKNSPIVNGALLFGPPGTGKTLLVSHAASKAKITCLVLKASDIHQKYYGQSEKILAGVFAEAKARAPSIIMIDEIDCVFPSRSSQSAGASHVAMLSQLLTELDGVRQLPVALIATSNRRVQPLPLTYLVLMLNLVPITFQ
ncbi:hypothetical protein CF326_g9122 [Tilletia indica]|nr:hypothetical protein CF326_g9122 [Tilletia indica]